MTGILRLSAGSSVVTTTWAYLGETADTLQKVLINILASIVVISRLAGARARAGFKTRGLATARELVGGTKLSQGFAVHYDTSAKPWPHLSVCMFRGL